MLGGRLELESRVYKHSDQSEKLLCKHPACFLSAYGTRCVLVLQGKRNPLLDQGRWVLSTALLQRIPPLLFIFYHPTPISKEGRSPSPAPTICLISRMCDGVLARRSVSARLGPSQISGRCAGRAAQMKPIGPFLTSCLQVREGLWS